MFYTFGWDYRYPDAWYTDNDIDEQNPFVAVRCPVYDGHSRARRDFNKCLYIDIKSRKPRDLFTTSYSDWLITDRTAEIFEANGFTGYRLQKVHVCNMKLDYNLWELIVTSSAGKAHPDAGIVVKESCEYCGYTQFTPMIEGVGIIINEANWDGSDFFFTEEFWKFIMVTERVKDVIEKNGLKGVTFIRPNEIY